MDDGDYDVNCEVSCALNLLVLPSHLVFVLLTTHNLLYSLIDVSVVRKVSTVFV